MLCVDYFINLGKGVGVGVAARVAGTNNLNDSVQYKELMLVKVLGTAMPA